MIKRNLPIFIFALAFLLRLIFILLTPGGPVYPWSDSGSYNDSAHSIHGIISHSGLFFRKLVSGSLGKGAGVLDTYGLSLPFGILHRGLIHPVFVTLVYLFFGLDNFKALWVAQAILDSLSCIFVYLIGRRLFSKKVGLLASFTYAVYLPFINATTKLMQETVIIFFLLSTALLLIKAIQDRSFSSFLLAGFCLFLVTTGRLTFAYLFCLWLACIIYLLIKEGDRRLWSKAVIGLFIGFIIPLFLWMSLMALEFGKFGEILMTKTPGIGIYRSSLIQSCGWPTDEDRFSLGPHLTKKLKNEGFNWDDQKEKWPPDKILLQATWKEIQDNPKESLLLVLERIRRQWLFADVADIYSQALHHLFMLLAVFGIFLALFKNRLAILISGFIIFLVVEQSLVHAELRYNLPAMPFIFLVGWFSFGTMVSSFFLYDKKQRQKIIFLCSLSAIFYLLAKFLPVPVLLLFIKPLKTPIAFLINVLLSDFFILFSSITIYFLLSKAFSKPKRLSICIFSYLCFVIFFNTWAISNKSWREWFITLNNLNKNIKQEIILPKHFLNSAKEAYIKIDMQQAKGEAGRLSIFVNNKLIKVYDKEIIPEGMPFPEYFEYQYIVKDPVRMRRWFSIPVAITDLDKKETVVIELTYEGFLNQTSSGIRVYGDYPQENNSFFIGPLFEKSAFETSIIKYLFDGDYRINGCTRLMSKNTISKFYNRGDWLSSDLSENPGIQNGQYRIRLEIIDNQGKSLFF